jgi:hypothetical protein
VIAARLRAAELSFNSTPAADRARASARVHSRKETYMIRKLIAAAFAIALVPSASFAGPDKPPYLNRLVCKVNANDGESLKVRIVVRNDTGRFIAKGTRIQLRVRTSRGWVTRNVEAWRDIQARDGIGFDQPQGAMFCSARVARPLDKFKITMKNDPRFKRALPR